MFKNAEFACSAYSPDQFPTLLDHKGHPMPEIAVVGRSNVGKSTLINHLLQKKNLAHVSSTPGKTQLINFFTVNQQFALVDLPGYGFAKVPKSVRENWEKLIQTYLKTRSSLQIILFLCDLRHPPSREDITFMEWMEYFKKPFLIVFTKADKLKPNEILQQRQINLNLLSEKIRNTPLVSTIYSVKDPKGRIALVKELESRIQWT